MKEIDPAIAILATPLIAVCGAYMVAHRYINPWPAKTTTDGYRIAQKYIAVGMFAFDYALVSLMVYDNVDPILTSVVAFLTSVFGIVIVWKDIVGWPEQETDTYYYVAMQQQYEVWVIEKDHVGYEG
ncbi:hypothetical protein M426DRAFT_24327 [Hypoxylon sp. CI-4A]|nr:hypothetical protein M426DRAFT_24327 [Hypoxylon sp. CI-4A]